MSSPFHYIRLSEYSVVHTLTVQVLRIRLVWKWCSPLTLDRCLRKSKGGVSAGISAIELIFRMTTVGKTALVYTNLSVPLWLPNNITNTQASRVAAANAPNAARRLHRCSSCGTRPLSHVSHGQKSRIR